MSGLTSVTLPLSAHAPPDSLSLSPSLRCSGGANELSLHMKPSSISSTYSRFSSPSLFYFFCSFLPHCCPVYEGERETEREGSGHVTRLSPPPFCYSLGGEEGVGGINFMHQRDRKARRFLEYFWIRTEVNPRSTSPPHPPPLPQPVTLSLQPPSPATLSPVAKIAKRLCSSKFSVTTLTCRASSD